MALFQPTLTHRVYDLHQCTTNQTKATAWSLAVSMLTGIVCDAATADELDVSMSKLGCSCFST